MALTDEIQRLPCKDIVIERDDRQRREIDTSDLDSSVKEHGVIEPIIVRREEGKVILVAGERRLAASIKVGNPDILCRFLESMDALSRKLIELEENLKRKDLPWQDQVRAVKELHAIYKERDPAWTQKKTSIAIGMSEAYVVNVLRVGEDLNHPLVEKAATAKAAANILARVDQRRKDTAVANIMESAAKAFNPTAVKAAEVSGPQSILKADFLKWAPQYDGPKFNFLHCDFPYGIKFNAGQMGGKNKEGSLYNDDPDVYWALIECLCENLNRVMATSAHLMFWFSMEHYQATLALFAKLAPDLQFSKFPLIWTKSDNVGILPDAKRGPRRVYETCLIASREDRLIVKPIGNSYSAPTDKLLHPSTKPEPMLRHFMQMFVDGTTRLLDPTCGSGSALRAAESLGAQEVLGLEENQGYFEAASTALKKFRTLRRVSK